MKKRLLILLFCFGFVAKGFAQETAEPTVFDYSKTKHELSLDIAPIIYGNYPSNLLYRKHYVSKKGNNVAFRAGANLGSSFSTVENDGGLSNSTNRQSQNLNVYVGKERQKTFHKRIIGFYGLDFGTGFSRSVTDLELTDPNIPNQLPFTQTSSSFNIFSEGFLGMRYHLSKHFSISAETSVHASYYLSSYERTNGDVEIPKTKIAGFNLNVSPLRAVRFAFHF